MPRQLRCPNCGGEHILVNPGITMLVCSYCHTVVYWDDETALKTGRQSILPTGDTRLTLNATGRLHGQPFRAVGHLRYDFGRGTWDEWYIELEDGRVAWLSEDERRLSLEQFMRPDPSLPPPEQLQVAQQVTLEDTLYTIREVGTATCVGGEGQLPFTVLPGERYPYADLASLDGTRFATLEYDDGRTPRCFAGQVLEHEQLTLDEEPAPATLGGHEGHHITCPNCAAPLAAPRTREVQTLVCEYCGAQNDLTGPAAVVLGINPKGRDPGFVLSIGQGGTLLGQRYEVCGRMLYEDEERYQTREYLLHNKDEGYLWLSEENGHYVLNRPTQQAPNVDPFTRDTKDEVRVGPTSFKLYETGSVTLVHVDGALPWLARTGETFRYADLIAPPQMFCVESDGQEVEYFYGRYLPPAEVWKAFGLKGSPRPACGTYAAEPFRRGAVAKILMVAGTLFGLLNLILFGWSLAGSGKVIMEQTVPATAYLQESTSPPFVIGPERIMALEVEAPLNNSWLACDISLVDSQDRIVEETSAEISYYHGVEDGESWSEGSSSETTYFKAPAPGTYRLIVEGTGGTGESTSPGREALKIRLHQGRILSRYFLIAMIFAFLFPGYEYLRRSIFESERWSAVDDDDDDDNDDDDDDD